MEVKTTKPVNDFSATSQHLKALNRRLVDLLGDDYAINLSKPAKFTHEGKPFIRFETRCIYYSHNDDHYDHNPSGWIAVSLTDGKLISGCWVCGRRQVVESNEGYQPAPTLLTLSRRDPLLLKTLLDFGCDEVEEVNKEKRPAVAFPVTYADGSQGYHFRVVLQGGNKWRHLEGGKAGEAVFALHRQEIQAEIQKRRFVIVTESPTDAAVLIAAGFPAIAVLGQSNANALACDFHRETLLSLLGDGVVYAWCEPDAAKFPQKVANALQRPVKVIFPPVREEDPKALKDAYRIWVDCGKDWKKFAGEISGLLQNATEVVAPQPEPVNKIVRVMRPFEEAVWRPLGEITMPENDRWQVEGLIKEGNLVILSARPKTAKSIVALNLAACVALGKPFLDRSVTQGRALFVAYERFELTLKRALDMGLKNCRDFMLWDKVAYKSPRVDMLDGWLYFIDRYGVKLVVFDTLAHFLQPELEKVRNAINAYDFVYKVMERLQAGAAETGCTFVLIHHDRKGETAETDEARVLGTTALTAAADAVFQLKPMGDGVICLKATGNAFDDTTFFFTIGDDNWLIMTDKPATTKEEKAARAIENYLRQHGEATRQDLIRFLMETGLVEKEGSASMLLQRAFDGYLSLRVEKRYEGKQAVFRLKGGSNRPNLTPAQPETEPADSSQESRPLTPIEVVNVVNRQGDQPDPTINMFNTLNTLNNDRHVKGVKGQADPDPQPDRPLTTLTNPIGVANVNNEPDPQGSPPAGDPLDSPQAARPEPVGSPECDPLSNSTDQPNDFPPDPFVDFFDMGIPPDLIVGDSPTEPEGDQPCAQGSPPANDPQEAPPASDPLGYPTNLPTELETTATDMEFVSGVSNQEATRDIRDIRDNGRHVSHVSNSQPDQTDPLRRETPKTNPISVSHVSNSQPDPLATIEIWDYDKVFGDLPDNDEIPPQPDRPKPDIQGSPDRPTDPQGSQPAGDPQGSQPDPFAAWFDEGFIPDLIVTEPAGSPQEAPPVNEPDRPDQSEGNPQAIRPTDQPASEPVNEEELWVWFTPERIKPSARAQTEGSPPASDPQGSPDTTRIYSDKICLSPTPPDTQDKPSAQAQSEGSPPDHSGLAACVEGDCVVVTTADWVGNDGVVVVSSDNIPPDQSESPTLEPEDSPLKAQPVAEPVCPICGEILEPDPESGLVACIGCGRLFKVEAPPASPDDEENPPEPEGSPDDDGGDDDNPPNPPQKPNNGRNGNQTGFAPPITPANPPSFPTWVRIYTHKFSSPAIFNRMTVRLPDGSVKLEWQGKTETVAPDDLAGWLPIEDIPEVDLPSIESIEIPPVVVLDIETTDLDPAKGRILAAGLALFVEGKKEETQIIRNEGDEAALLEQVFDWLRETCYDLGEIVLTGYNIYGFDLPYLIERARKLKVDCPFRFVKDENGEIVRRRVAATEGTLKGDPLDYPAIVTDLPISVVDTQHLVCRWDYTAKALRNYDLKSVAAYFGVNQPDRPILSPAQIQHAFQHDPATFEAYLLADLRETFALFAKLIQPYAGIATLTEIPLDQIVTRSTAWIWEQILERYYDEIPQPDEKRKYEGGLVVSRSGLWSPCLKLDIASLYPTIMLAYRIHSRKDPAQIALRWLKTLTGQRLELKAKAKEGDANAQILQEAMKILLNSLYGFYGTGGYGFNDMTAAEKVTEIGRKVLTSMIAAIEDAGGIIVEADTDGIIVCYRNADPQEILQAVTAAIPPVFKVELEWQQAVCFVSDDKNYIVLDQNGDPIAVKGSKWRGRDKEAYLTQAIPTFVRLWATEGVEAALAFAAEVFNEIRSGHGWRWVVRSHRVGKGDKFLVEAGLKVGEIATYAYKDRKRKTIAKSEIEGYDCDYYAAKFSETIEEVIAAIDPAQIAAWREIVGQEARPLIFGVK